MTSDPDGLRDVVSLCGKCGMFRIDGTYRVPPMPTTLCAINKHSWFRYLPDEFGIALEDWLSIQDEEWDPLIPPPAS